MRIAESNVCHVPMLKVIGDVDHYSAPILESSVDAVLERGFPHVLLDLESCPYLDSGGLNVLLQAVKRVRECGWLGVIASNAEVLRILSLVGLTQDPDFRVFSHVDEARMLLQVADSSAQPGIG